jgi:hypothetical protein
MDSLLRHWFGLAIGFLSSLVFLSVSTAGIGQTQTPGALPHDAAGKCEKLAGLPLGDAKISAADTIGAGQS